MSFLQRLRSAGLLLPLLVTGAWGCQSPVRLVWRDGPCGVVAIPNNSDTWPTSYRSRALNLIGEECPDGFQLTDEGEVVLKDAASGKGYEYEYDGALQKVETKRTEYRIRFCALPPAEFKPVRGIIPEPGPSVDPRELLPPSPVPTH
jgi:hypothetical protein